MHGGEAEPRVRGADEARAATVTRGEQARHIGGTVVVDRDYPAGGVAEHGAVRTGSADRPHPAPAKIGDQRGAALVSLVLGV